MTDTIAADAPKRDRFGFTIGVAESKRRAEIAAAQKDGEPFDGLTGRDIALMVERGVHAIMAAQTVRGRFLGNVDQAFVLALYIAGTAGSEDVIRLFDRIAEGRINLKWLLEKIRSHLADVEVERKKDEKERREADADSIVTAVANAEQGKTDGGAVPQVMTSGRPGDTQQVAATARPAGEARQGL